MRCFLVRLVFNLKFLKRNLISFVLLGKHFDGVWHTGIVAFGKEWYFGNDGIDSCPPVRIFFYNNYLFVIITLNKEVRDLFLFSII